MTVIVLPPGPDRAVGCHYEIVESRRGNHHDIGEIGRNAVIGSPGDDCAIGFQCEAVPFAGGNRHDIGQSRRNVDLPDPVVSPTNHCALLSVTLESEGESEKDSAKQK